MIPPFSRASEYAIRALTHLAQRPEDGFVLVPEIARTLGVPAPFLAKVLQPLAARGLLASRRGRGGGYRLDRTPGAVTLAEVVELLEPRGGSRVCLLGQDECSDERACPLHDYWKRAWERYGRELAGTTLADLVAFCAERPESGYPAAEPPGR